MKLKVDYSKELTEYTKEILNEALSMVYIENGHYIYRSVDEDEEVDLHYGQSHLAVALLILGISTDCQNFIKLSENLIRSYLLKARALCNDNSYHADFNNFAFVIYCSKTENQELKDELSKFIVSSKDSNHMTVNWLPMRMHVNLFRHSLSNERKYRLRYQEVSKKFERAINGDYLIEDQQPFGVSFNTQYSISSLALLHFHRGSIDSKTDISFYKSLKTLILPDNDINYLGRGAGQIFAWGPWIYLLSASKDTGRLNSALRYLKENFHVKSGNLFMTPLHANSRYQWYDYHRFSVYLGHLAFWLALAQDSPFEFGHNIEVYNGDRLTGIRRYQGSVGGAILFEGRSEYFSERGPMISALWINEQVVFKAPLGPFLGRFGNDNSYSSSFLNQIAIFSVVGNKWKIPFTRRSVTAVVKPRLSIPKTFIDIVVDDKERLIITFSLKRLTVGFLNIPVLDVDCLKYVKVCVDGEEINLLKTGTIIQIIGELSIFQSKIIPMKEVKIII